MIVVTWAQFHCSRTTCHPLISFRPSRHSQGHPSHTRGMDSHTNRKEQEQRRQAEIRQQIALLQTQLTEPSDPVTTPQPPRSPKRKTHESTTLAPATPSPSESATKELYLYLLMHSYREEEEGYRRWSKFRCNFLEQIGTHQAEK